MATSKLWNKDGWWRGREGVGGEVGVEVEHIYIMLTFHPLRQLQHRGQGGIGSTAGGWGKGWGLTFHPLRQLQHRGQGGIGSTAGGWGKGWGLTFHPLRQLQHWGQGGIGSTAGGWGKGWGLTFHPLRQLQHRGQLHRILHEEVGGQNLVGRVLQNGLQHPETIYHRANKQTLSIAAH